MTPALIDDQTVARLLAPPDVLAVIASAFRSDISCPARLVTRSSEAGYARTLLSMPAMRESGLASVKIVTVIDGPRHRLSSHLLAFSPHGDLLAVIEAHTLTAMRTAAASVLAAKAVGAGQARRLAVIGAGRQARAQIAAFASFMPLQTLTLWARNRASAERLATDARHLLDEVRVASSAGEAARSADLITCATASEQPLLLGADVRPGTHIDLVGGFQPTMREADDAVISRAIIVADTAAALAEAGDLTQPIEAGLLDASTILLLGDLLSRRSQVRAGDLTLFKSVGHAAEDLVVTELLLEKLGIGVAAERSPRLGLDVSMDRIS